MNPAQRAYRLLLVSASTAILLGVAGTRSFADEARGTAGPVSPPSGPSAAPAPHRMPPEHDMLGYGLVLDPLARPLTERRGIEFAKISGPGQPVSLVLDLVVPAARPGDPPPPVVVFVNGVGDAPGGRPVRDWGAYRGWARLVASYGMAGVNFAARGEAANAEDVRAAFHFVHDHAAELGVDGSRLAAWACSANVSSFFPLAMGSSLPPLRGAVLYYGFGSETGVSFRRDLPVLLVRSGLDRPQMNEGVGRMLAAALSANAPWTTINLPAAHHAFDVLDDTEESRDGIRRTVEFLQARLGVAGSRPEGGSAPAELSRAHQGVPPAGGGLSAAAGRAAPRVIFAPPALARSAMAHFFGGEWEQAAADYRAWLTTHPEDGDATLLLANALVQLHRVDEARDALRRATELLPEAGEPVALLGRLEADARHHDVAEPLLRRAAALLPDDGETRFQLGKVLLANGRNEEAASTLEEAVRLVPGNGYAWSSLAMACYALKRFDRSIEAWQRVLRYAPDNPTLLYNLACAQTLSGRADQGFESLGRAIANGFRDANLLTTDPDIAALRDRPGFPQLVEQARRMPPAPAAPQPGSSAPAGGATTPGSAPPPAPGAAATAGTDARRSAPPVPPAPVSS